MTFEKIFVKRSPKLTSLHEILFAMFFLEMFLKCYSDLHVCMHMNLLIYMCTICVHCLQRPEESTGTSGSDITNS